MICWPRSILRLSSSVRVERVSLSWRVRSSSALLRLSAPLSSVEAWIAKRSSSTSPRSSSVEVRLCRRMSNSLDSVAPEEFSA
ncbi:hypothetical protein D3C77_743810 [compost metagenome]